MDISFIPTTNMLLIKDDKILMIQRSNQLADFPGWYVLPGGKQTERETIEEAATRETLEETGITTRKLSLKILATNYHDYKSKVYLVFFFTASEFEGELKESKEGTPKWMPIADILTHEKTYPDLKWHIKMILESKSDNILLTYQRFNQKLEVIESR